VSVRLTKARWECRLYFPANQGKCVLLSASEFFPWFFQAEKNQQTKAVGKSANSLPRGNCEFGLSSLQFHPWSSEDSRGCYNQWQNAAIIKVHQVCGWFQVDEAPTSHPNTAELFATVREMAGSSMIDTRMALGGSEILDASFKLGKIFSFSAIKDWSLQM
jgi:hypothetical protein